MNDMKMDQVRDGVRDAYGKAARGETGGCCCSTPAGSSLVQWAEQAARQAGYTPEDLACLPEGANLGLGCGAPAGLAGLRPGETVLDLGAGAGVDCFIAANKVGAAGRVIGVDMTPDMLRTARENAAKAGAANVEFRLGEIENLPVADSAVDVVISNCVINLSPDKPRVWREMFRALKPGGRVVISDVVAVAEMPGEHRRDMSLVCSCIGGAQPIDELRALLDEIGFASASVEVKENSREIIEQWYPGQGLHEFAASAMITAKKPEA